MRRPAQRLAACSELLSAWRRASSRPTSRRSLGRRRARPLHARQPAAASSPTAGPRPAGRCALMRPPSMMATMSTWPSAVGRWVMTMTMPPRWRTAGMAWLRASSPAPSRLALGSSSTTRKGSPIERPGQRHALALAARQRRAALADRACRSRSGSCRIMSWAPAALRGRDDGLGGSRRAGSGRCSRRPCRRTARRPAAGSRYGGRARPAPIGRGSRRRGGPRRAAAGQTPTRARARVDLPEALGPMRPRPWPAWSCSETPCTIGSCAPGAPT